MFGEHATFPWNGYSIYRVVKILIFLWIGILSDCFFYWTVCSSLIYAWMYKRCVRWKLSHNWSSTRVYHINTRLHTLDMIQCLHFLKPIANSPRSSPLALLTVDGLLYLASSVWPIQLKNLDFKTRIAIGNCCKVNELWVSDPFESYPLFFDIIALIFRWFDILIVKTILDFTLC